MSDPLEHIKLGSVARLYPAEKIEWVCNTAPAKAFITSTALRILADRCRTAPLVNERLHGLDDEPHGLAAMDDAPTGNPGTR